MPDDVGRVLEEFRCDAESLASEVVRLRAELSEMRARQIVPLRRRSTVRQPQIGFRVR